MESNRQRWSSRTLFIFAAVGSAVGLGNVWRFPYLVGKYGGGAFVLPYIIALFTIGLPLLIMEFALGQSMQKGSVGAYKKIHPKLSGIGLGALINSIGVISYYSVIMGWCLLYAWYSFSLPWAEDPKSFFFNEILQSSGSPDQPGGISLPVLSALIIGWILIYFCLWKGVRSVGKVVKITMPLPVILMLILLARVMTLPGAKEGLLFYITPDFNALLDWEVWLAAITQVFFTLTLGFGAMITYASYMKTTSDIITNAIITAISDAAIALTAGFVVFGTIGYMSFTEGQSIESLAATGPSLAFIVLSKALSLMPGANFFSFIFFLMLITLAIDSLFALVEAVITFIQDFFTIKRPKLMVLYICIFCFLSGLIYTTAAGIYYLDIADHFVTNYLLILFGMLQAIAVGWAFPADKMRHYINKVSSLQLNKSWDYLIRYIIPFILFATLMRGFYQDLNSPYGNYPDWTIWVFGWGFVIVSIGVALLFSFLKESYQNE